MPSLNDSSSKHSLYQSSGRRDVVREGVFTYEETQHTQDVHYKLDFTQEISTVPTREKVMSGNKAPVRFRVETPSDMSIEPEQTYSFEHARSGDEESFVYEEQKEYVIDTVVDHHVDPYEPRNEDPYVPQNEDGYRPEPDRVEDYSPDKSPI